MELKIEYVPISDVRPYAGNAKRHTQKQIQQIQQSIEDFGFNDPVALWHGEIVEGHGRVLAAQAMGFDVIPVIRLDDLTDDQRRAYTLVHNKLTMDTGFDTKKLAAEIEKLPALDMDQFGFKLPDLPAAPVNEVRDAGTHNVFENQERRQYDATGNWFGIPDMSGTDTTGDKLLRFCDFNQVEDHENYIAHFYYDDFKFIAAWRDPDKYLDKLKRFKAVISPNFSLYTDFPRALQILSCYRRQWCGVYWQEHGIDVIPNVAWGDEESYKFCFLGIPKRSVVSVSTVGVTNDKDWNNKENSLFLNGYKRMLDVLDPTTVILYGSAIDGLEGNIIRVPSFYEERRGSLPKGGNDGNR